MKSWLTQTAGAGRTPYGERGLLRPTGLLTLPGEDWSPPGKRPRNSYTTNLDGLCQGGPEGEIYPKTTRTGKTTKKTNKKEVWKSLVRASSSAQPTEEKKEEVTHCHTSPDPLKYVTHLRTPQFLVVHAYIYMYI